MALKKMSKKKAVKSKKQDEELEHDAELEQEEAEAEEEEGKTLDPEFEDESEEDPFSRSVSGKDAKGLARGRNDLPADGDWVLRIKRVQLFMPDAEKERPGSIRVTFQPTDTDNPKVVEPDEGFRTIQPDFLVVYPKGQVLTEGQKMRAEISESDWWSLCEACFPDMEDDEEYSPRDLAEAMAGIEVMVTAKTNAKSGYQNLTKWRPVEAEEE